MENQKGKFGNWLKTSITARMLVVGVLLLVLLIPLGFVKDLIYERAQRQADVITEINQKWGNEVLVSGPILKIPYKYYEEKDKYDRETKETITEQIEHRSALFILPDELNINSIVDSKPLERGIYKSVVFSTDMKLNGFFPKLSFEKQGIKPEDVLWNKASILIKTSNLKGIKNQLEVSLGQQSIPLLPKYDTNDLKTLQSESLDDFEKIKNSSISFEFALNVNGSESVQFIPVGKKTSVSMESNWPSPSFTGNFLPEDGSREITENGFKARWKVLQINRQFEQRFKGELPSLRSFAFGTDLIVPVDEYQKSERTAKYGVLVIGLTLLVFLLIQIVSKIYIHPFQYLMIGLALVMFYTLLISISEHGTYFKAYLIAGISVITLIGLYTRYIFHQKKFPLLIVISLSAIYSFIYVIIQLENYALLIGSIGLFLILAGVMFASRKIDWSDES